MNTTDNKQELPPASDIYKTTRGQIEHYDNGINQRVIWLSIGQSFFFGVYGTLVSIKAPTPDLVAKQTMLAVLFPIAAFLTAIFTFFDVIATLTYLRRLRRYYEEAAGNNADHGYPPVYGRSSDRFFQHISPVLIPLVFILTWAYLLLYDHKLL